MSSQLNLISFLSNTNDPPVKLEEAATENDPPVLCERVAATNDPLYH